MTGVPPSLARWASDRRVAWAFLAVAVLLAVAVVGLQQRAWTPAYTDYGQEGDRYTFPLNGRIGEQDGVSFYWARCGHNGFCGPIAFRGDPPWGADHVVLRVPSRDPAASTVALPQPIEADCSWRGDCPDGNTTTVTLTQAWGPYAQAPVRWQQAAAGAALALLAASVANVLRGLPQAVRAGLGTAAGALLGAGLALDFLGIYIFLFLLVAPALLVAGVLALLGRKWPVVAGLPTAILWALAGWLVQSWLFVDWFPGPPTM